MLIAFALPIIALTGLALSAMAVPVVGQQSGTTQPLTMAGAVKGFRVKDDEFPALPNPAGLPPVQKPAAHAQKSQASQGGAKPHTPATLSTVGAAQHGSSEQIQRSLLNQILIRVRPLEEPLDNGLTHAIKFEEYEGKIWIRYGQFFRGVGHSVGVSWENVVASPTELSFPYIGSWAEVGGLPVLKDLFVGEIKKKKKKIGGSVEQTSASVKKISTSLEALRVSTFRVIEIDKDKDDENWSLKILTKDDIRAIGAQKFYFIQDDRIPVEKKIDYTHKDNTSKWHGLPEIDI